MAQGQNQNDFNYEPEVDWNTYDPDGGPKPTEQAAPPPAAPKPPPSPWDRNSFRDAWMGTGTDVGRQDQLLSQYGIQISGNGTATLPSGEIMDLRIGARSGQNLAGWTGVGEVHNGVSSFYSNSGGGGGAQAPAMPPGPPQNQHDPKWDALYQQLMDRSKQTENLDPSDPIISGQVNAYSAQQDRSRRNYLADLAESAGPYASGAQLGQARQTSEAVGQNVGNFQSQLMGRELQARRQEIQDALSQMGGMLTEDQRIALQRELGYMNDATQRFGIQTGADTNRYGVDSAAQTAANRLGLDTANSSADYWLRSQGL
jgi:hypothetical protein